MTTNQSIPFHFFFSFQNRIQPINARVNEKSRRKTKRIYYPILRLSVRVSKWQFENEIERDLSLSLSDDIAIVLINDCPTDRNLIGIFWMYVYREFNSWSIAEIWRLLSHETRFDFHFISIFRNQIYLTMSIDFTATSIIEIKQQFTKRKATYANGFNWNSIANIETMLRSESTTRCINERTTRWNDTPITACYTCMVSK